MQEPENESLNGLLSIIIPCYNEEKLVQKAYESIITALEETPLPLQLFNQFELLFIDDGSQDRTLPALQELTQKDVRVKIISFSRRFGKEAALSAGLTYCEGDLAILFDVDLQDPPALILQLINSYRLYQPEGCHIVNGIRTKRRGESWPLLILAKLYYKLLHLIADVNIPEDTADFKLLDRTAINAFRQLKEKNKFIRGLVTWTGLKQVPFHYERAGRQAGRSKFSFAARLRLATRGLTYFSVKPLKLIKWLGLLGAIAGTIVLIGFNKKLNTLGLQLLFTGIQFIALGFVGEYVGNIFEELKDRPEYIIERAVNVEVTRKEYKVG